MIEVEMLNVSDKGKLMPLRFRIQIGESVEVVKIASAVFARENRKNGNRMQEFRCKVANKGNLKEMMIYYEIDSCIWYIGA